jgi:hypothetical protein
MLTELQGYGRVILGQYNSRESTWSCKVELFVNHPGAEAQVGSGFGHPTARDAVVVVYGRVLSLLRKLP